MTNLLSFKKVLYRNTSLMLFLLSLFSMPLYAETVYITDSLLVGLHEEKSINSAIVKVLPTGTALEVIKRNGDFVHVRDPKGISGWISNSYLMANKPLRNENADTNKSQSRIRELEAEVKTLGLQQTTPDKNVAAIKKLKNENGKLKKKIKSDKLKSGELQANLAELRNKISRSGINYNLNEKMQSLIEENTRLKDEMKKLEKNTPDLSISMMGNSLIAIGIALLTGLIIGIFLMDWRERYRHGGLRF